MNNNMNNHLLVELNKYKDENVHLKQQVNNLQQENYQLKIQSQNNNNNQFVLSNYNSMINNLKNDLSNKEKEIKELKDKITNLENIKQYDNLFNTITVKFISVDGKINCDIKCLESDIFAEVEEKLYEKYDEYRLTDNIFLVNGNKILRFKKMCENNIKNGEIIQIQISSNLIGSI